MSAMDDVRRAELAREVLTNEVYIEAYDLIEKGIYAKWRDSRDKSEQEELHRLLLTLAKAKQVMEGVLSSGEVAADNLRAKASHAELLGRRLKSVFAA